MPSIDDVYDVTPRIQYVASPGQTAFDYPFPIFEDVDLAVDVDGVTQALTTDYTVSGEGEETGGTVTFLSAMAGNEIVTIYRDIPIDRLSDFQQNGPYSSVALNDELDRMTLVMQQLQSGVNRSLRFPVTSEATATQTEFSPIANWLEKFVYINASGIPEPATAVDVDVLTQATIGSTLYPQTAAEASAGVTPVNYYYEPGNVLRYGTNTTPGTTDMTAAIQAAADAAGTYGVNFLLPEGRYLITSTINLDVPNNSRLLFIGEITTAISNDEAIIIGNSAANTFYLSVSGLKISRSTNDTTGTSVGVQLLNVVDSNIDLRRVAGFRVGVKCLGDSKGFAYNTIILGSIWDNRTNLQLAVANAASGGYCNENSFIGGSFSHGSGYPSVSTINLEITHDATNQINNNRFYGPSFEDIDATNAVAAVINGVANLIFWPRMERSNSPTTYQIQFTSNATVCQIIGGHGINDTNISDSGIRTSYETLEGKLIKKTTADAVGKAVLALMSSATGNARLVSLRDASNVEQGYLTGTGYARLHSLTVTGTPVGVAGAVTFGDNTQSTVGAAGGASALPATPSGYLRFFVGTTEYVIPYYAQA